MCGIVGAVARRDIVTLLTEGLARLEYRGCDSTGLAVYDGGTLRVSRNVSRVADLKQQVAESGLAGFTGIAHTRWATH
jgi:glucosamine--fructose-6-phosphate aminotransferase (isomerizing)